MPMDGFTLSYLAQELSQALTGGRVERVNQPERDALLILMRCGGENHRLLLSANANQARAQLTVQTYENPAEPPMFCMLMRKHLQGARLASLTQPSGDRVLCFLFDCLGDLGDPVQKTLVLEMMGRYSNLTLVDEKSMIVDSIRHVNSEMSRVRMLLPGVAFAMPPAQDKLAPDALTPAALAARLSALSLPLEKAIVDCVAGMAGVCAREACARIGVDGRLACDALDASAIATSLVHFWKGARNTCAPVVLTDDAGLALDFFPFPYVTYEAERQKPYVTLSAAMDAYYLGRDIHLRMQQRSAGVQKHIKTHIARLEKKQAMMLETLQESERADQYRVQGELLTANLHLIQKGAPQVTVPNYYDEAQTPITIPLQTQLSPAKNAQAYYKKYRKAKGAEQYAREQLQTLAAQLQLLDGALDDLEKCATTADLGEIRLLLTENGFLRPDPTTRKRKKAPEGQPYRFTAPDGTELLVGKNAVQNDRLTLHARGGETWLHAQGIPGSHVIIRTEQEPAAETLLLAAKLAAYYSKGRNHPSLPVDYVKRKYIKKSSGSPVGFVTYTNHQTIHVGLTPEDLVSIGRSAAQN